VGCGSGGDCDVVVCSFGDTDVASSEIVADVSNSFSETLKEIFDPSSRVTPTSSFSWSD
jgi:hypothetical protein